MRQSRSTKKGEDPGFPQPPRIQIITLDEQKRLKMIGRAFAAYAEGFHSESREIKYRVDKLESRFEDLVGQLSKLIATLNRLERKKRRNKK